MLAETSMSIRVVGMIFIRVGMAVLLMSLIPLPGRAGESLENWSELQGSRIALPNLIQLISGKIVYDWDGESVDEIKAAAQNVITSVQANFIEANRINEVGNRVEDLVMEALIEQGFTAGRPRTESGRKKSAGYPDLFASDDEHLYYIEIKTYSSRTINSTQRTFYISPSEDFKVAQDGFHLLLAFSTEEIEDGVYSLTGYKLLDLYSLECKLKLEFNASNRDLYGKDADLEVTGK